MDRQRGYTLIELMMVVALIGISMAIAVPTMSTSLAETRQAEAALEVVSVFRSARAMAMRRGTPTLAAWNGAGRFWLVPARRVPGAILTCGGVNWPAEPPMPTAELDLVAGTSTIDQDAAWDAYGITAAFNVANGAICYSPLGRVYISVNGVNGPWSDAQNAAPGGALQVLVNRPNSNPRRVIVPMGSGVARLRTQ